VVVVAVSAVKLLVFEVVITVVSVILDVSVVLLVIVRVVCVTLVIVRVVSVTVAVLVSVIVPYCKARGTAPSSLRRAASGTSSCNAVARKSRHSKKPPATWMKRGRDLYSVCENCRTVWSKLYGQPPFSMPSQKRLLPSSVWL
jgi:hypothetical protein